MRTGTATSPPSPSHLTTAGLGLAAMLIDVLEVICRRSTMAISSTSLLG